MKEVGLKQVPLAKAAGVSQGSVSSWLAGTALPRLEQLKPLADALGVTPAWLIGTNTTTPLHDLAFREGEDLRGEVELWKSRATAAEKELCELKEKLRDLLKPK